MSNHTISRRGRAWVVPSVVLGVLLVLVGVVLLQQHGSQGAGAAGEEDAAVADEPAEMEGTDQPDLRDQERRDEDDLLATGPIDAPVALVVYSDYQCPFCARWSHETLPTMMEYVDAGDLRIEWRDVNVFGEDSERAARASYAAALQDRYWDYHDALYPEGEIRSEPELAEDALIELAGEMGLDTDQFAADMTSEDTEAQIQRNAQEGLDIGAHSTPVFILGGQPIVGAQPTGMFVDAMDTALESTGD